MTNNTISSIMVPEGYIALLFSDSWYWYRDENRLASILGSYLDDETQELECFSAPEAFVNDALSYLRIIKIGPALGYWIPCLYF